MAVTMNTFASQTAPQLTQLDQNFTNVTYVDWSNVNFSTLPVAVLQALGAALVNANALPNVAEK